MISVILFTIGTILLTSTLATLAIKLAVMYAGVQMLCAGKINKTSAHFKSYLYGLSAGSGIALIVLFALPAKTYALLSII